MSKITHIQTETEYDAALARIDQLMDCAPDSPEAAELDRIADLVIEYEAENYPMAAPEPAAMIEFVLDQAMISRAELARLADGHAQLDAMMAGDLAVTPELAQARHHGFGIAVASMLQGSESQTSRDAE